MRHRYLWALAATAVLVLSRAVAGDLACFDGQRGNISIAGGTAHLPIMYELKHGIESYNPDIHILVRGGGSSVGIEQVGRNLIDIGNAGRQLKPKEQELYDLRTIPLAIDAIAVVVHPSNPLSGLSVDDLRAIYSGEITNWSQVGGDDRPIVLYDRGSKSGTYTVFKKKLLPGGEVATTAHIIRDHDKMKVVVSWDRNAIGYMSLGHVDESKVKPLALNHVQPTLATAQSGEYLLSRNIYMYVPADAAKLTELTRRFIDYVNSPSGAQVISNNGYIPIN